MVTVHTISGMRFVIFVNDHEPAHVHVFGAGQAKINLLGPSGKPDLLWTDGMKRNDARRAMRVVMEQQEELLKRWRDIHG